MIALRAMRFGCLLWSLLMLILVLIVVSVILIVASTGGGLPKEINDPVVGVERAIAQHFLNSDLSGSNLSVTSITVTPAKTVGHAAITIKVSSSVALPKDVKPLAAEVMAAAANHLSMPLGMVAGTVDSVTVMIYGPNATKPTLTATVPLSVLNDYASGKITKAVFISKMNVK